MGVVGLPIAFRPWVHAPKPPRKGRGRRKSVAARVLGHVEQDLPAVAFAAGCPQGIVRIPITGVGPRPSRPPSPPGVHVSDAPDVLIDGPDGRAKPGADVEPHGPGLTALGVGRQRPTVPGIARPPVGREAKE